MLVPGAYAKGNVLVDFEGEACDFDGGLVRSVGEILRHKKRQQEKLEKFK